MVAIYVPLFWMVSPGYLLKFIMLLNNIIRGKELYTRIQKLGITRKLVVIEALRVFEKNNRDRGKETNGNCKLEVKYLVTHFFPQKELQCHNRYL